MNSLNIFHQPLTALSSSKILKISAHVSSSSSITSSLKSKFQSYIDNSCLYLKPQFQIQFQLHALTESSSDSSQSLDPSPLLHISDCFDLPPDYFKELPSDLRLDLNDAAFDLSSGPVIDECGQELGELLLNLARAWEIADTSTSRALASKLPVLEGTLTNKAKAALGNRLISAGRRFQSMGQYGQGEMQKVAQALITTGKLLSRSQISTTTDEEPKKETRVFKFGELQVAITPEKANIGVAIGVAFGILSWGLGQGVQSIPESSMQYANDNALLLAKSLRGALLVLFYSTSILSAFTSVGLFLLARQLKSGEK